MPGVCFFFEENSADVWSGRPIDLDAWRYAILLAGDVDRVHIVNRTAAPLHVGLEVLCSESSELPAFDGVVAHAVCPWDAATVRIPLWDFDHRVDWYVFGPAAGWHQEAPLGVYIPQAGMAAVHSVHAATVFMAHRYGVVP